MLISFFSWFSYHIPLIISVLDTQSEVCLVTFADHCIGKDNPFGGEVWVCGVQMTQKKHTLTSVYHLDKYTAKVLQVMAEVAVKSKHYQPLSTYCNRYVIHSYHDVSVTFR